MRKKAMSDNSSENQDLDKKGYEPAREVEKRSLSPAAKRALAEAEARRDKKAKEADDGKARKEVGGRDGPDPVRFGDWENGGIASDF